MLYVIYFFTIVNGNSVLIDTMPVPSPTMCVQLVDMINSQPSPGGRRVRAACYIKSGDQKQ